MPIVLQALFLMQGWCERARHAGYACSLLAHVPSYDPAVSFYHVLLEGGSGWIAYNLK